MKVSTNSIGNYNATYLKTPAVRTDAASVNTKTPGEITNKENISAEEKKFFANLYPAQKEEVFSYQFYNSKGKISGVHVGSLFDRRG
ncbi:MAG: hypothetical protein AB1298_01015 [Bacteroidota bacterium]